MCDNEHEKHNQYENENKRSIRNTKGPDVSLFDENPSMVDRLGHAGLEDEGLEAALEEVLDSECKDVIQFVLGLVEETVAEHAAEESLALKDPARIFLIESEEITRVVADAAEGILNPPQLPLAP